MPGLTFTVGCFGGVDIAGEGVSWTANTGCLVGLRLVLTPQTPVTPSVSCLSLCSSRAVA